MYDLIGDIHGHAEELAALLEMLGYRKSAGVYRHPERQAIFFGDFIDRGPRIRETLEIVRTMVEHGSALAVMGNHEWNALPTTLPIQNITASICAVTARTTFASTAKQCDNWTRMNLSPI